MLRSLFTIALSLFLFVEVSAQTVPAASKKTAVKSKAKSTKATARTTRRAAEKSRVAAVQTAPVAPVLNDGWPPLEETQTAVASATTTSAGAEADVYAGASESRGELDNANVYAAPGKPVHIPTSSKMAPYSVRPPRKAARTQTTLGN